jgi:hypothetical protein
LYTRKRSIRLVSCLKGLLSMDIDENNPHRSPKRDLSSNADRELFQAVLVGDTPGVSAWLARGADVNARDTALGRTPLFHAVALPERKPAIAELLLARGANVRARPGWPDAAPCGGDFRERCADARPP